MEPVNAIELLGVTKRFGEVVANDNVNLTVRKGEILSILGENGSGKTTLMNMLSGIYFPDEGEIRVNGKTVTIRSPKDSFELGIGMIHQHFKLINILTAAENIILGLPGKERLNLKQVEKEVKELTDRYGFDLNPSQKIYDMSVSQKQTVEIVKVLYRGADILILDEPTAVLTPQETEELFVQLLKLKEKGHTIIFISHKLDEIKKICDRATIMRNGKSMGTYEVADISTQEMSKLMVGHEVSLQFDKNEQHLSDNIFLKVRNLTVHNSQGVMKVDDLSFDLKGGEILGIAGVEGNGQTELIDTITGLNKKYKGSIQIKGKDIAQASIRDIRDMKLAHIPEDRMTSGCARTLSIKENLFSNQYRDSRYSGRFFMKQNVMDKRSDDLIREYLVKCKSRKQNVGMLSGGNIQKVIVAREFSTEPDIIIANQPTRGIDVGAAAFIRKRLLEFRDSGCAIILISADLTEIFSLSDRLAVMYKGKFAGFFNDVEQVTEDELGQHMLGIKKDEVLEGVMYE